MDWVILMRNPIDCVKDARTSYKMYRNNRHWANQWGEVTTKDKAYFELGEAIYFQLQALYYQNQDEKETTDDEKRV